MKPEFILVSQSPRRRELLKQAGYTFTVTHVDTPETLNPELSPEENTKEIAATKILTYLKQYPEVDIPLVSADTIVVTQENEILGKPKDRDEAIRFIQKLQGKTHTVITGISIHTPKLEKLLTDAVKTTVYIDELSQKDIEYYVDTFRPYDKAGAYGVQDWFGLRYIYKIEGCYYNVVGFPVSVFEKRINELKKANQF